MHQPEQLTRQERKVVLALLPGSTNREVADRLFVSMKTVETHLTRIYRKLGCRSRGQVIAAYYAGDLGEILPASISPEVNLPTASMAAAVAQIARSDRAAALSPRPGSSPAELA